jgi:signal transduction histidine kinase
VRLVLCVLGTVLGLYGFALPAPAAEEEARVLILNGFDPYLPANLAIDTAMRATLSNEPARRIVLFSESLDAQRFPVEALEAEYLALLTKKYSALRIDVVVAVTQAALEFFKRHGEQLWPGARVVYEGFAGETMDAATLPPGATGVVAFQDVRGTIDIARRMQPEARRIVVISGVSDIDRRVEQLARKALSTEAGPLPVEFLSGLPLPELVARIAAEPADTIVIYLAQFRDRIGRPYTPREVLRAVSKASAAPVYGVAETYFGFGAAAGSVESYADKGRLVAEQVLAALGNRPAEPSRILLETPSRCVADARALQRWSLDVRRLATGCEVRFAERPFWRDYFWQILATLGVIAGQALLIATLLVQLRRRRKAEAESLQRFSEMAHLNRRVALGEMSASMAHELNQPLGAIRNNAGAAELLLKADPPRLQEVAEILSDIKRDDQRASDIIARIRRMLRKGDFEVRDIDLNAAIGEAMKLLAEEAAVRGVTLKSELDSGLPPVSADRIEIKQVIVNLVLNAIEAMRDQPEAQRQLVIRSRRANPKEAEVSVADSGAGIPAELLPRVFDAFVTSKATGMGLGLAISRTIVEKHRGQIRAENPPSGGATLHFTLPFAAGHA